MNGKAAGGQRREDSLTRERIVEAAIELLDASGESGLTFRSLSERLATGPGAIYWHIADKSALLIAACDAVIEREVSSSHGRKKPEAAIRALALEIFDAMAEHPWLGSALRLAAGQLPMVRILEGIGSQVQALGVSEKRLWSASSALMSYILGVAGQNAANREFARVRDLKREDFLDAVATEWAELDAERYPFTRGIAERLSGHDDRADFLAGIDLILAGIRASG